MHKVNHDKTKIAGRSLVELMIAITIGLFILIAVSALFLSNSQTSRTSDDKSRLEDEGRLALNLIAFHLRMAGYGQLLTADYKNDAARKATTFIQPVGSSSGTSGPDPVQGCVGGFANPVAAVISCTGGTTPDALSIRYVVDLFNANVTSTGIPAPTDCLGQRITAVSSIVENRFFIRNNATTGRSELYCIGNGNTPDGADFTGAAQPIAENIIDLRITYGTSSSAGQSVDGPFVDANNNGGGVGIAWGNVLAVNVCLVGQSASDGVAARPQQYRDCAGQLITAPDRRLYSTFSTVVTLRSKV
jgi:type IV pilus assembly protein PilW